MKKNVAGQTVGAQLISKTDGSPVTTGNTDVYVTGDGGTQTIGGTSPSGGVHEGNGYWSYPPTQAETNYDHVAFTFVNASAINATVQVWTSNQFATQFADELLDRDMSSGTDSGSATVRTVRQALRFLRNKWTLSAGTLSVKKEDDSTESWTATVTTDAAAVPIIGNDPASS